MGRKPVLNKDLDAVISLNISHLHDAANFFALIKNQIERGEDLDELRKFSKGAAYHFRSLFEELKAKKELINNKNSKQLESLYIKELIDLNDLLDLEILQHGYNNRLIFINHINARAEILANFGLLSKLFINIVENALKYSEGDIILELQEYNARHYEIKIKSSGNKIPEYIANDLSASNGHGLSAAAKIMSYHAAEIKIHSLAQAGSIISLRFKKASKKSLLVKNKLPGIKSKSKSTVLILGLLILSTSALLIKPSKNQTIIAAKPNNTPFISRNLRELNQAYLNQDRNKYYQIKDRILKQTSDPSLANYAIVLALPQKETNPIWKDEVLANLKEYPEAYELKLSLASRSLRAGNLLAATQFNLGALLDLFKTPSKQLQIARNSIKQRGSTYYLSAISKANPDKDSKTLNPISSELESKEPSVDNNFDELNQMINMQDQELGLDLDL